MENISLDTIWQDDLLGRRGDAEFLEQFLVSRMEERKAAGRSGAYVMNLDAGWGFGKTFFMTRLLKQLELSNHPVVMIDAWKNDFSDDPYTNVIAEIESYFQSYFDKQKEKKPGLLKAYEAVKANAAKLSWIAFKGLAKRASRYVIAEGTDEIVEVFDQHVISTGGNGKEIGDAAGTQFIAITDGIIDNFAKRKLNEFNEAKVSLDNFRNSLRDLLEIFEEQAGKKLPLFILVDELDRCRPTYAIAMLERIKHLFDAENVVFILSTDTTQLAHSINAVYGMSFDSRRYLQRFFSRTYELPAPRPEQLMASLFKAYAPDESKWANPGMKQDAHEYLTNAALHYKMSLRETEQAFDILASLTTLWQEKSPIQLGIMVPLILGHLRAANIGNFGKDSWLRRIASETPSWVTTDRFRTGGFNERREVNRVGDWLLTILDAVNKPLYKAMTDGSDSRDRASFPEIQVNEIVKQEYGIRFGNNVVEDKMSLIASYPELIRHAGRLSTSERS